jgi:hypothetical protein
VKRIGRGMQKNLKHKGEEKAVEAADVEDEVAEAEHQARRMSYVS